MIKKLEEVGNGWSMALKWVVSLGVLGALVIVCGALIYLVRESNRGTNDTANNVLVAWTKCAQELPAIASQIRDDARLNATFMREFTDKAHEERILIREELAGLRKVVAELVQVMKESEQRKNGPTSPTG